MARTLHAPSSQGPFRADQLRSGDPYELSHGHAIRCLPTGGRGSKASRVGGEVLASDPLVEDVGFDTGYAPTPDTLRAPDLSVGRIPDEPGWVKGVPKLAVEYADTGQDEAELAAKIDDLLTAGTKLIWVVRLTGPRRVEVFEAGKPMKLVRAGELLEAPGILANPVPVEALYDAEAGREITLRNLLQRQGYQSLDEVRAEGEAEGEARGEAKGELAALRESVRAILETRGLVLSGEQASVLAAATDREVLRRWQKQAVTAATVGEALLSSPSS